MNNNSGKMLILNITKPCLIKIFYIFIIIQECSLIVNGQNDNSNLQKPYNIKSCKIVYNFINGLQKGEKTIIFDSWGMRYKEIVKTNLVTIINDSLRIAPDLKPSEFLVLKTPDYLYNIDLDKRVGYKGHYPFLEFSEETKVNIQKIIGKDTILGKYCDIVEIDGTFKVWMWNKIVLKKELTQKPEGFSIEEYAVFIDENYTIKPDEFELPKGITLK